MTAYETRKALEEFRRFLRDGWDKPTMEEMMNPYSFINAKLMYMASEVIPELERIEHFAEIGARIQSPDPNPKWCDFCAYHTFKMNDELFREGKDLILPLKVDEFGCVDTIRLRIEYCPVCGKKLD